MNLDTLLTLSQIAGTVVVVATLIAILVQMNQTNRIAKAELTMHVWMQTGALQLSLSDSPEKSEFMQRLFSGASLSEAEGARALYVMGAALGTHEAGFNLRSRGLIEEGAYSRQEATTRLYMISPGIRAIWRHFREYGFEPRYRDLVDRIAAEEEAKQASAVTRQEQTS